MTDRDALDVLTKCTCDPRCGECLGCRAARAVAKLERRSSPAQEKEGKKPYTVLLPSSIPGAETGCFSTHNIKKGESIDYMYCDDEIIVESLNTVYQKRFCYKVESLTFKGMDILMYLF